MNFICFNVLNILSLYPHWESQNQDMSVFASASMTQAISPVSICLTQLRVTLFCCLLFNFPAPADMSIIPFLAYWEVFFVISSASVFMYALRLYVFTDSMWREISSASGAV